MNNKRFFAEQPKSMVKVAVEIESEMEPKGVEDCFKQEPISNNLLGWAVKLDFLSKTVFAFVMWVGFIVSACRIFSLYINPELLVIKYSSNAAEIMIIYEYINIIFTFAIFVICAVLLRFLCRISAALLSGYARNTQCRYAMMRMEELKIGQQNNIGDK